MGESLIELSSIESKLAEVFEELAGDLANNGSGTLFIQVRSHEIVAFGLRQNDEMTHIDAILQPIASGLSVKQQNSFRSLVLAVLRHHPAWIYGELQFLYNIESGMLCSSVIFNRN